MPGVNTERLFARFEPAYPESVARFCCVGTGAPDRRYPRPDRRRRFSARCRPLDCLQRVGRERDRRSAAVDLLGAECDPAVSARIDRLSDVGKAGRRRTLAGQPVAYGFDAAGFRRQRVAGAVTTRYLLGGAFETDAAGQVTLSDVAGPAGDLTRYAGPPLLASTVSFLYYSGHGDLAAEADSTGTRTAAYTYDPFGAPLQPTPTNQTT